MAARRDRPRSEHPGGMAAQVVADGNPPGQAVDGVELRLRHVHVVPARLRHRRGHQVRAPDLVAGGRQVRPHDHRYICMVSTGVLASLLCIRKNFPSL